MPFSAVLFDLDGTLLYTLDDLTDAVNVGLREAGFPPRTVAEVRNMVGNGIRKLIERAVPAGTEEAAVDRVHAAFTAYYTVHDADKTRAYSGVTDLVARLRKAGLKTAVVSNKAEAAARPLVERFFPGLFDVVIGERPGVPRKPAPDGIFLALDALSVDRAQAVFVGDSDVDYRTAVNARVPCVSVTWGFRDRDLLSSLGATVFADTPEEAGELILNKPEVFG